MPKSKFDEQLIREAVELGPFKTKRQRGIKRRWPNLSSVAAVSHFGEFGWEN